MEPLIGPGWGQGDGQGKRIGARKPLPRSALVLGLAVVGVLGFAAQRNRAGDDGPDLPSLRVMSAVVSQGDEEAAGYLSIVNEGAADQLVAVDADVAGRVSVHRTEERDGVVTMVADPTVAVAAEATTTLAPGATHLMLEDLARPLVPGDELTLVLSFGRAGPITVTASVVSYSEIAQSIERP